VLGVLRAAFGDVAVLATKELALVLDLGEQAHRAGPDLGGVAERVARLIAVEVGALVDVAQEQLAAILEVRILDMVPRPSRNPDLQGRIFGSSVAAWWGYHYDEFLSEPKPREAVTIYEIFTGEQPHAQALYSYRWQPQTDPSGVLHQTYDYPGVPVAAETIRRRHGVLDGVRIPLRPHFGVIGVAPREPGLVDSVPPAYFGGNLDNWRLGKGAAVYLPVSVPEALLSVGDPHAAQGDGELSGTAIECSMTGTFRVVLHKK